jgi:hypothetical protein
MSFSVLISIYNTENYLTTWFGDYMTLPPKSQQIAKHSDVFFFCNSAQFAKEASTNYLIGQSKIFYYFSIRRLIKDWASKARVFNKLRGIYLAIKKLRV